MASSGFGSDKTVCGLEPDVYVHCPGMSVCIAKGLRSNSGPSRSISDGLCCWLGASTRFWTDAANSSNNWFTEQQPPPPAQQQQQQQYPYCRPTTPRDRIHRLNWNLYLSFNGQLVRYFVYFSNRFRRHANGFFGVIAIQCVHKNQGHWFF